MIIHGIHYLRLVVYPDALPRTDLLIKSLRPVARAIFPVRDPERDDHDAVAQSHEGDARGRVTGSAALPTGGSLRGRGEPGDAAVDRYLREGAERVFLGT